MKQLHVVSIDAAIAGLLVGLYAAYYWWKASTIEIDPGWRSGVPQSAEDGARPIEPVEPQLVQMGWTVAMLQAATQSSELNKRAARLTAVAVFLSGLSGILGAVAGHV